MRKLTFLASGMVVLVGLALGFQNCTRRGLPEQNNHSSTDNTPTPTPTPTPPGEGSGNQPQKQTYNFTSANGSIWNAQVTLTQVSTNEVSFVWNGSYVSPDSNLVPVDEVKNISFTFNAAQTGCQRVYHKSLADPAGQTLYAVYLHGCYDPARKALTIKHHGESTGQIRVVHSGKCLEIRDGSTTNGTGIQQASCTVKTPNDKQSWVFRGVLDSDQSDLVQIYSPLGATSFLSGKCLDVSAGSTEQGANLVIHECHQANNQRFQLKSNGDGSYNLVALNSGMCLDLAGGSNEDGASLNQYPCHGGANQKFQIANWLPLIAQVHTTLIFRIP